MPGRRKNPSAGKGAAERLRRWIGNLGRPEGVRIQRRGELRDRLDDYAEAVALAEAGEQILAERAIARRGTGRKRIMVLGHGADYSARLAEYAILLAERLGYGLVFLNVDNPEAENAATPEMRKFLRESFARKSGEAARPWLLAAAEKGVEAGHVVRFGEQAKAVEDLCGKLHRVELILSEPEDAAGFRQGAPSAVFTVD